MRRYLVPLAVVLALLVTGCGGSDTTTPTSTPSPASTPAPAVIQAKSGDTVAVHYTGRLDDGTVFDTSVEREPLRLTLGQGQYIPAFEQAIIGMKPGESRTVSIPANEAYGPYREELVVVVDRAQLPPDLEIEVGMLLESPQPGGGTVMFIVIDVSESSVTLDANHRLAGKDLTFDIELVEID